MNRSADPHAEAVERLLAFPGVVRVELGLKEIGGEPVEQWAYRVHVLRKRPLDEIPSDERLPQELNGIAIDVLPGTADPPRLLCGGAGIEPGDPLARWLPNSPQDPGTVCAVVRKGSHSYLMTNFHVVNPHFRIAEPSDREVYVPDRSECMGIRCNKPAGHLAAPEQLDASAGERPENPFEFPAGGPLYQVDVSLVRMVTGRKFTNAHSGLGGALNTQPRDLRPLADASGPPQAVVVKKRGRATNVTGGTIVGYTSTAQIAPLAGTRVLNIRPDNSATEWTKEFEFVPRPQQSVADVLARFQGMPVTVQDLGPTADGRHRMRAHGRTFVQGGDSGSPLVDGQRNLVGIVFAAGGLPVYELKDGIPQPLWIYDGIGLAAFIIPTFAMVGLDPATAIVPSGESTAGAPVVVPGSPIAVGDMRLRDLDDEFSGTPARDRLRALAARHLEEVFDLIHERRRVLLVWHRSKGPGFVMEVARAIREPGQRMPTEIDGVTLSASLVAMRDVLCAEGNGSLRETLEREGDWLIELAERCAAASDLRAELLEATASATPCRGPLHPDPVCG